MACELVRLTNADAGFYPLLGPFLGRRDVARELGARPWDEDGKAWFAVLDAGAVAAFAAAVPEAGGVRLCSAWTAPGFRGRGFHSLLVAARLGAFPGRARAVCTEAGLRACLSAGFEATGRRGRFTVVSRAA